MIIVLLAIVYLMAWKSPQYYIPTTSYHTTDSIVPFEKYTGEHERPFIIKQKRALIFGATHTKDPNDPQIPQMEELWGEFHPTIALVEGRLGFLLPLFMNPVKELGEGGWVKSLAHKDGVKIMNWDLSKEGLADSLQQYFTKEQIALQQILNPYFGNLRFGKPTSPEKFIKDKYVQLNSLTSPFRTAEKFLLENMIDPRDTRKEACIWIKLAYKKLRTGSSSFGYRP